jgi:hypothetical protein
MERLPLYGVADTPPPMRAIIARADYQLNPLPLELERESRP